MKTITVLEDDERTRSIYVRPETIMTSNARTCLST
jgi:hypothetical protein